MSDIRYVFTATGADTVKAAFRSIGDAAQDAGAQVNKAFGSIPRVTQRAGAQAARTGKAAARQTADAWSAAGRPMSATEKLAQRVARDQERSAKRVANTQIREAQRAHRAQQTLDRARARDVRRHLDQQTKLRERHERESARAAERVRERRGSRFRGAISAIGGAAITGAGALMGAGAYVGGRALRESLDLDDAAKRIAIQGGDGRDPRQLRRSFENTATAVRGVKAADVASGVGAFVTKTGDLDFGLELQKVMAEFSLATGTSTEQLGTAMGDMMQKFDIKTVEEMADAMAMLTVQGKNGAFELEDAAQRFPEIAAAAQRFGLGKGTRALGTLGGMTQLARMNTGSGAEAATSVEAMFRQLIAKSGDIKKVAGVDVFKDKDNTITNDFVDVLTGTIAGAKGDLTQLQKIFDVRGISAVSGLVTTFNQTKNATQGTEAEKTAAGMAAMRRQIEGATNTSGAYAEVQRDLATAQSQSSAKMTAVWESLKAQIGEQVTPAFAQLLKSLGEFAAAGGFTPLVTTMLAVVEAFEGLVSFLKGAGLLEEKVLSPEQHIVQAEEKIIAARNTRESLFQKVRSGGELSPEEMNQLTRLNSEIVGQSARRDKAQIQQEVVGEKSMEELSVPEFIKRFTEADSGGFALAPAEDRARHIAKTLMEDPTSNVGVGIGRSDEQNQLIQAFRDTITQMQTTTDPQKKEDLQATLLGAKELQAAAGKLSGAADKLAGAAVASNLPQ